ncbi:MAG: tape measure protein [Adhaeribacter sp.]
MASIVEFLVKVKDMASGPFSKLAATGTKSFSSLERNVNSFTSKFNRLGMSISDIDKRLDQLKRTREISVSYSQIRNANREISELERRKARLGNTGATGGFGRLLGAGLLGPSLGFAGIAGGASLLGGVLSSGMEREATETQFEVMAGKKQGSQLTKSLASFAQKSIYGSEVFGVAQQMLSFGIGAEKVMPYIKMIGDVSGGNAQKMKSISLAFSQVSAAGKLTGQDLLQFVNTGFNPLKLISEKTGKSMAQLATDVSDGKVSFNDVVGAMQSATNAGGRFHKMTETLGNKTFGKWQALKGSVSELATSFGTKLLPAFSKVVQVGQFMADNTQYIYGGALAWGAYTAATGLASLATEIQTGAITRASVAQNLFNLATKLNPWGLLAAGLAGTYVWLDRVLEKYGGWGVALNTSWTTIKAWTFNVKTAFLDAFQEISYWIEMGQLRVKQFYQFIKGGPKTASVQIEALQINRQNQRKQNLADIAKSSQNSNYAWDRFLWNKNSGKSADSIGAGTGGAGFGANGLGGVPASMEDSNKGITGGGVRNLTINLGKFLDNITIQTTNLEAGVDEIEDKILEMFLRVTNAGQYAISNQ